MCRRCRGNFDHCFVFSMHISTKSTHLLAHWLILGAALLIVGCVAIFHVYQDRNRTQEREQDRLLAQARVLQENISQNLLAVNQVLLHIRSQLPKGVSEQESTFYLQTLTDAMPGVRTLVILDADGKVHAANRAELLGRTFAQREYFQNARHHSDAETLYVSPPFHTSLGVFSITVSRAILGRDGRFSGVVAATLDPGYFAPLLDSVSYTHDMVTSIVHWNGTRFLMRPKKNDAQQKDAVEKNLLLPGTFFSRHREGNQEATVFSGLVFATGEERMIAQRTVKPAALKMDPPLVVAVSRRLDGIYATWRNDVYIIGLLYALSCIFSVAGLYAYQRKHLESISKQGEAIRMIEANDRFMKTLTDHIPGMVAYWTDTLHCRFSNAAYLDWFGKTPEQMHGIHIQDLMGQALFEKNEPFMRAALRGERQQFERALTKPDGSIGYTWAQYIPDKDGDKVKGFVVLVSDVTKLKQVELALADSEWKLKTIIEAEPECVTVLAKDGRVQQMNRAGLDIIGTDAEAQVIGFGLSDMILPQYQAAFSDLIAKVNQGESGILIFELVGRKGVHRWLECHAVPMRDRSDQITGALCVIRNITDRKKVERELEALAQTDFLTGLANRRHFLAMAEQELARTIRYGGPLSVLMMDIDNFKKINDTYGHKSGDIVLQTLAKLCLAEVRNIDIIGRFGGEEFAAVLPQTDGERALDVAERLRETIAQAEVYLEHGLPIHFTMSIGVASRSGTSANIDTLISWADTALYEAKNAGRNRVRAYKRDGQ